MKKYQLILALSVTSLTSLSQAQKAHTDPFAADNAKNSNSKTKAVNSDANLPKMISVCHETFSLPLPVATAFQREGISDAMLYQRLIDGLDKGTTKQESFTIIRTRSGEKTSTENAVEEIYPTEWKPAEMPNNIGIAVTDTPTKEQPRPPVDKKRLADLTSAPHASMISEISTSATATTFETRNTGLSMEIEGVVATDYKIMDIRLSLKEALLIGRDKWGQEENTLETPKFESRSINIAITTTAGKPSLVGTFNRPSNSKIDPDAASKVWFTFITPTLVTIRP